MRPTVVLEGLGAAFIVAGLAILALWAGCLAAGSFLMLAARAAEPTASSPSLPRVVRR